MCRPPIRVFSRATALGKCLLLSKVSAIGRAPCRSLHTRQLFLERSLTDLEDGEDWRGVPAVAFANLSPRKNIMPNHLRYASISARARKHIGKGMRLAELAKLCLLQHLWCSVAV